MVKKCEENVHESDVEGNVNGERFVPTNWVFFDWLKN